MLQEVNRRYQSGDHNWKSTLNGVGWFLYSWKAVEYAVSWWLDGVIHLHDPAAYNRVWQRNACKLVGWMMIVYRLYQLLVYVYYSFVYPAAKRAAEQKAALQNAQYRAAWYRAQIE
jgi:hypothetical protein